MQSIIIQDQLRRNDERTGREEEQKAAEICHERLMEVMITTMEPYLRKKMKKTFFINSSSDDY